MKINYRQISILVFLSFIALKFLALPSLISQKAGNMTMLVALIMMSIDAIYVAIILDLLKKNESKNVLEFMNQCVGKVLTRVILVVLIVKYALVIANISKGLEFFVISNLYREMNWLVFILPLIILIGFMVYKGLRNIARVGEMICWAVIIGMLYIGFKAIGGVELISFLPLFHDGAEPIFTASYTYVNWFGSGIFLLMLFGKVDFSGKKKFQMVKYVLISILLVQFLYFIFYGLFQVVSGKQNFCISDISQYSTSQTSISELSWLVVSMWIVAQAVQLALYCYCLVQAVKFAFNIRSNILPIVGLLLFILIFSYIGEKVVILEKIFWSPFTIILSIVAQYIIPLILYMGYGISRMKERRKAVRVDDEEIKNTVKS